MARIASPFSLSSSNCAKTTTVGQQRGHSLVIKPLDDGAADTSNHYSLGALLTN